MEICREDVPRHIDCYHAKGPLFWRLGSLGWTVSAKVECIAIEFGLVEGSTALSVYISEFVSRSNGRRLRHSFW